MSKTFKQKVWHIIFDKDGRLNLKGPRKLRWSYINQIRRHNFDRDIDRAELANRRDMAHLKDMRQQIKDIQDKDNEDI